MSAPQRTMDIEWEHPPLVQAHRDAELERWAKDQGIRNSSYVGFLAPCPWLLRALVRIGTLPLTQLDQELDGLVTLVVSRDNSCRYCYAGARVLLRVGGMADERIDRLEGNLLLAGDDPTLRPALEFTRHVSRSNPPPTSTDLKALREAGYSELEIKELTLATGSAVVINRLTTFFALSPERRERMATSWWVKTMRPLLRPITNSWKRRRKPEVRLKESEKQGPFSELICALDGLPAAPALRGILDEAWTSQALSPRAKALIFAVIARGLGDARCEREAFRLLEQEGLPAAHTEEVLAHLSSKELDSTEAKIVPFARETIWYQPAPIQRRAREMREGLSEPAFLELVGLCAIANMLCRISLVLSEIEAAPA